MTTDTSRIFSGFWPRLGAWFIDAILLGIVGCAVGWLAMDYVSPLGSNGRFIGLPLAILYHGVFGSRLGGGQTVGKRLMGLKVVDLNGKLLNPLVSLWRAGFLVAPAMLNGWYFNVANPLAVQVLTVVTVTAVFGIGLAQTYLILFSWPARRLVHDLLSGSVVVRTNTGEFQAPKMSVHVIVAAGIILASLGLALTGPAMLKAWAPKFETLVAPQQRVVDAVEKLPGIADVSVLDNTSTVYSNGQTTTTRTLIVTARTGKWPTNTDPLIAQIGAQTVKSYAFAPGQNLTIKIVHGFDLGIASYSDFRTKAYTTTCTTGDVKCLKK